MRKTPLTLEQHLEVADDLAIIKHHFDKIFAVCNQHYPKSYPVMKTLWRILWVGSVLYQLRSRFEDQFWEDVGDETARKHGFIHYNLDQRYAELCNKTATAGR